MEPCDDEHDPAAIEHPETPIRTTIQARDRVDRVAMLADFGGTFTGRTEIARWDTNENVGVQSRLSAKSVDRSGRSITVGVTGNGFNGDSSYRSNLEGDQVVRMLVSD